MTTATQHPGISRQKQLSRVTYLPRNDSLPGAKASLQNLVNEGIIARNYHLEGAA